ncbi:unnamed protein product [Trichogramma brassicae]|uniref:Uncharacterized protein n=1 Tax=Trichogramma brassicae TaxID=86971 RepID=A0A6H5J238_9HYME|nr:unnamed protein product [Trichogramma brassicae]
MDFFFHFGSILRRQRRKAYVHSTCFRDSCVRTQGIVILLCHGIRGPFAELALFAAASSGDELAQVGSRAPRKRQDARKEPPPSTITFQEYIAPPPRATVTPADSATPSLTGDCGTTCESCANATTITEAKRPCLDAISCEACGPQRIYSTGVATDTPRHTASTAEAAPRPASPAYGPSPLQSTVERRTDTTAA